MISAVACMALAIYFEARGEPAIGQIAVGHVILNRTLDKRFPENVCEVVFQGQTYKWKPDCSCGGSLPVEDDFGL